MCVFYSFHNQEEKCSSLLPVVNIKNNILVWITAFLSPEIFSKTKDCLSCGCQQKEINAAYSWSLGFCNKRINQKEVALNWYKSKALWWQAAYSLFMDWCTQTEGLWPIFNFNYYFFWHTSVQWLQCVTAIE